MDYRQLGRSGVKVSTLSLGAMNFGPWGNEDEGECSRIVQLALNAGINLIDTADVYSGGLSEEILGKALKGRRDEVVLATKFHNPMGQGVNDRGSTRLWITRAIEGSLRRLQTDHIDLYQLHRPDPATDIEETLGALTDLVTAGKIRYIGTTTFPAFLIVQALWTSERRMLARVVAEQPPYSIFARHAELDVLPVARAYDLGILAWSPLAGGWLTGKYRQGQEAPADTRSQRGRMQWAIPRFDPALTPNQRKFELVVQLEGVAREAGLSLLQMALAFPLSHPTVNSIILGPRTPEQLQDLLAASGASLDSDSLDAIDEIVPPGVTVNPADRGWDPPWMAHVARRRSI